MITQEIADCNQRQAIVILDRLLNNQHVSRWDCLKRRSDLFRIINNTEEYSELYDEVWDIIESAKESL